MSGQPGVTRMTMRLLITALVVFLGTCAAQWQVLAQSLESVSDNVKIDPEQISVSGISSGAFMAHQFHVSHSANVMGMGAVAGGPYFCADGNMLDAITKCSSFMALTCAVSAEKLGSVVDCEAGFTGPASDADAAATAADSFAEAQARSGEEIDDVANLARAKVYLFRGENDVIVPLHVMGAVYHFYADADKGGASEDNVIFNDTFAVRHAMVTDNFYAESPRIVGLCNISKPSEGGTFVVDCSKEAAKVIEDNGCSCTGAACPELAPDVKEICAEAEDIDLAGAILTHIYGELEPRAPLVPDQRAGVELDGALNGLVVPFSQKSVFERIAPGVAANTLLNASMADTGYIYIPDECRDTKACPLHVAFHGCKQGGETGGKEERGYSGNVFSKYAGYNEWANTNGIVVLYPQVREMDTVPLNPQGCWDWWGQFYTHDGYHTKRGLQTRAVAEMINVLLGEQRLDTAR